MSIHAAVSFGRPFFYNLSASWQKVHRITPLYWFCGQRKGGNELRWIAKVRGGLLLLGAAFVIWGVGRQEHLVVLKKAVKICLECIGVG